jgi:hypothetical protein
MFFGAKEFFDNPYNVLHDIYLNTHETHNLIFFHTLTSKNMKSQHNLPHLNFFHNNISLSVFFYKANSFHDDSFFNICVCGSLIFFRIFSHIEKLVFINCISPFLNFFHISSSLRLLKISKADIYPYGSVVDMDEGKKGLFSFHIFGHMNVAKYLFSIKD